MLEQERCVAHNRVQIDAAELAGAHAREVQQPVDNLRGAEGLLRDLFQHGLQTRMRRLVCAQLLAEHLSVAGDDSEWSVDLVRNACGKETDRRELLRLRELRLHVDAVCDVIHNDDATDGLEVAVEQGSDGDIRSAKLGTWRWQPELVERRRSLLGANAIELGDEFDREDLGERTAESVGARRGEHDFHLRIPAFDAILKIDCKDTDVDRLHDVLVEVVEALELEDLALEAAVKLGILDRNADVAGERLEQHHVFAGKEVTLDGATESENRDRCRTGAFVPRRAAGNVIVQIERGCRLTLRFRQTQQRIGRLEEKMAARIRLIEIEEAEIQRRCLCAESVRSNETEP